MRPQFELGQRLWPITRSTDRWTVSPPFDFVFLMLRGQDILYSFTHEYGWVESDVFPSAESALAACNARNPRQIMTTPEVTAKDQKIRNDA